MLKKLSTKGFCWQVVYRRFDFASQTQTVTHHREQKNAQSGKH